MHTRVLNQHMGIVRMYLTFSEHFIQDPCTDQENIKALLGHTIPYLADLTRFGKKGICGTN